jgi:hypothetical protein
LSPRHPDQAEIRFLTAPQSAVRVWLDFDEAGRAEVQVYGNRAGLLSLATVLLWLLANSWRLEFLSFAELPFVQVENPLSFALRVIDGEETGRDGLLLRTDRGEQFEWRFVEDDLRRVALQLHRLALVPTHEYDRLVLAEGSAAGVRVRMTDALAWI